MKQPYYKYSLQDNNPMTYTDWYLPSKDEFDRVYTVLVLRFGNIINLNVGLEYIWSYLTSSEYDSTPATLAWCLRFNGGADSGQWHSAYKTHQNRHSCRPIRSFADTPGKYVIGKKGPAGGYIFAIESGVYYECSLVDIDSNQWSYVTSTTVGTSNDFGTGRANTTAIIAQQTSPNILGAAKDCEDYSLSIGSETLLLTYAPQEWASDQAFWERSMTYWGIFRSFSSKELTFIKDGAQFLKEIFVRNGTEGICNYQIEALDVKTYTYTVIYNGLIDLSTFKYICGNGISFDVVKVQVIDNDFINKIKNKENLAISLTKLFDLNGAAITPFATEGTVVTIPQRVDTLNATISSLSLQVTPTTQAFPLTPILKEDDCVIPVTDIINVTTENAAFFKALYQTTLTVNLILQGTVTFASAQSIIIRFKRYNDQGVLKDTQTVVNVGTIASPWIITLNVNSIYTFTFFNSGTDQGGYLVLEVIYSVQPVDVALTAYQPTPSIYTTLSYTKIVYPNSDFLAYPYHEAFTRILQAITGIASPFYSEKLGRTDSEIEDYSADGDLSLGVVTNGVLLRGFDVIEPEVALNVSLKELFTSLHAICPLSLGIETIGGIQKIRIEELRHVFRNDIFLTIEGATNITEEVAADLTFSELSVGFSKSELYYLTLKGKSEYNTSVKYSTPITRQQNTFNQASPYRADTNAIVQCLALAKALRRSTSTGFDADNFLINFVRSTFYQVARGENYSSVSGTENNTNALNLDYQPARNLLRWGSFLRGCLDKFSTKILSFISSTNNSQANSQRTDEGAIVYEGQNINISDLDAPFFENIYYAFDFVVTNDMIEAMEGNNAGVPNYYNLVRFRNNTSEDYKYGWIMRFDSCKPDNKGQGKLKLLKAAYSEIPQTLLNESGEDIQNESGEIITV